MLQNNKNNMKQCGQGTKWDKSAIMEHYKQSDTNFVKERKKEEKEREKQGKTRQRWMKGKEKKWREQENKAKIK